MQAFEGKVAVITGAAEGIGRALAERSGQNPKLSRNPLALRGRGLG